jgi:hypothetical protein
MFAFCYRIAKHAVAPMALLTVFAFSTGVATARPTRHARHSTRHKVVRRKRRHSHAAAASAKKGSHKGSTGGSKGSKHSKGSGGGSTGGSTGGSGGSTGGAGGSTGGSGGSTGGSTGGSGGSTGGLGGSTGGSGGSTGGSGGSTGGSTGGSGGSTGGSGGSTGGSGGSTGGSGGSTGGGWVPPEHLTWYWQLQGTVNNSEPVEAYDIDGFENTAAEVATLHAKGIHAICYIDVGTDEEWRPDASEFPASVVGKSNGWPGEKYLDITDASVFEPIMVKRFEMCKEKGFDAVEPDNMDTYEEGSKTGFTITAAEQATYDEWVATEVHSLGMAVLQKNDGEQTAQLEPYFDGALTEQCNQYSECSNFQAYLSAGKPVLNAEYSLATSAFCVADNKAGIMGARFSLELNGTTFEPCW